MAIYAVQALYAAGCLTTAYSLCRKGLNLPFFSNHERVLLAGEIKDFIDSQGKNMGLKKEVVVIEGGDGYLSRGNTWFSGKVSIGVPAISASLENTEELEEELDWSNNYFGQFKVTHLIAHITANDYLITLGAVLAASLFTTFVLTAKCDLFTRYLGGLGVALITFRASFIRAEIRADQVAMEQCSKEVNQAYLDLLLSKKKEGYPSLHRWIFEPSIDERIGYFEAYINAT